MLGLMKSKLSGSMRCPPRSPWHRLLLGFLGTAISIGILAYLAHAYGVPLLIAPFGASCALLFAAPDAPLAQPRNVIGGHLVASFVGLAAVYLLPTISPVEMGIVVGLGILAMQITRTLHPPAGADPIVVMVLGSATPWTFLLTPVLVGTVILVFIAVILNNLERGAHWPKYWF